MQHTGQGCPAREGGGTLQESAQGNPWQDLPPCGFKMMMQAGLKTHRKCANISISSFCMIVPTFVSIYNRSTFLFFCFESEHLCMIVPTSVSIYNRSTFLSFCFESEHLCMIVLTSVSVYNRTNFLFYFWIWAPQGTAVLFRPLPLKSRKRLVWDAIDTFATCTGLVPQLHRHKMAAIRAAFFRTFEHGFLTNQIINQQNKSIPAMQVYYPVAILCLGPL